MVTGGRIVAAIEVNRARPAPLAIGLLDLFAVYSPTNLRELKLSGNRLTNSSGFAIANRGDLENLRVLDLRDGWTPNPITDIITNTNRGTDLANIVCIRCTCYRL